MKDNYEKYMKEVWDMKEKVYRDFKKSGCKSFIVFINQDLEKTKNKLIKFNYGQKK